MSKTLTDIRRKIDALDDQIHDVLMERAGLIDKIVAEKRARGLPFVHPAREAQMIRRLLKRHKGPLPEAAIVRIWRELVGAVSLIQTGLRVSVVVEQDSDADLLDLARYYFGAVVPMRTLSNALLAVGSVRDDESSFAVLPWPQDDHDPAWWVHLLQQDQDMHIICALPYGLPDQSGKTTPDRALVISKTGFMPSGDDNSFLALDLDRDTSRARIISVLQDAGAEPISICSHTRHAPDRTMHLIEVKGYITHDDERLKTISSGFEDPAARCTPMGGYPVPPVYKAATP